MATVSTATTPTVRRARCSPVAALDRIPRPTASIISGSILYAMDVERRRAPAHVGSGSRRPSGRAARRRRPRSRAERLMLRCLNERFLMIFGTRPGRHGRRRLSGLAIRLVRPRESRRVDHVEITSQVGYLDIQPASPIICASATRNGIIIFTAKKAYSSTFLGAPYIYNYVEIGSNCTPWSPQSISATLSMAVWVVGSRGRSPTTCTSILPMNCLVRPWVDSDIDLLQVREQACLVHVGDFNEVWWFFPQDGQTKNTRCIYYSYKEGWWGAWAGWAAPPASPRATPHTPSWPTILSPISMRCPTPIRRTPICRGPKPTISTSTRARF